MIDACLGADEQRTFTIGITGISGSGTSSAAKILAEAGGFIVSADMLVHTMMLKGQPAYEEILACFGTSVIGMDDEIDRKSLGALVFGDTARLAALESIIHPRVITETRIKIAQTKAPFAVIDAPLLIESGMHILCDSTWLITAKQDIRINRIIARDGLIRETAVRRLASRKGDDTLRPYADIIIENDGGLDTLRDKTLASLSGMHFNLAKDCT